MRRRQSIDWMLFGFVSLVFVLGNPSIGAAQYGSNPFGLGNPSIGTAQFGTAAQPGGIQFHPYITVSEEYNNNILTTSRNKVDDFITNVEGGLNFSTVQKNYGIDLNYQMGYVFYAKHHDLNFLTIGPSSLNAWYALDPNLTFRVTDYIQRGNQAKEDIYNASGPNQYYLSTARGEPAIYTRNVFSPSMEYRFGKEDVFSILYRNNYYNNESRRFEDSEENTISPTLNYWFDIHNGVSLNYYFTYYTYQRSPDQFTNGVTPRYTYRIDPRTSIFGEFHFENQNFKSPGVDYNVYNPSIGIQYQFSPTLSGTAQVGYYWQVPVQGGKEQGPTFNVGLTQRTEKTTYSLSFVGGYTEDYGTAQNLGFTQTYTVYGTVQHQLTQKLSVGLTGSVGRDKYSSNQKDWVWGIWGNASYQLLKWLSFSLQLNYIGDNSNRSNSDYTQFRAILSLTARL